MDSALPDWESEAASRYACGQGDDVATEFYGKTMWVMDPATQYWQEKYARYARQIAALAPGVNTTTCQRVFLTRPVFLTHAVLQIAGLYMDQVSGACALPCRGPYLGHPAGGGTSWVDGNRALFAQAKTALGTGRAVVSESNAEVYLSSIDGFLSLYGWNNCGARQPSCPTTAACSYPHNLPAPGAVPAFQSVYGGFSLNIGAEYQSVMTGHAISAGSIFTDDLLSLLATQVRTVPVVLL